VIGAGKGSLPIARALEEIVGDRIRRGFVAVKQRVDETLRFIDIHEAGHPSADQRSLQAASATVLSELGDAVATGPTGIYVFWYWRR
jgi:glycerate-2-kinase